MSMRSRSAFPGSAARSILAGLALLQTAGCAYLRAPVAPGTSNRPSTCEEVQVGYGTLPRRAVSGAIESRTAAELHSVPAGRLEEWLAGRFAGLHVNLLPNGEYSLRIRGPNSFLSDGEPLVAINGIPSPRGLRSPLRDLSPRDIARVDVLKDAGATAVFGVRGANGVILITTKRYPCN